MQAPFSADARVRKPLRFGIAVTGVLIAFFASGACGLLYQVVWTRKLALLFGTTAYAVSTVLSIFFLGLGLGSLLGGRLADRSRCPLRLYGIFEIIIGLWAAMFILALPALEPLVPAVLRVFDFSRPTGVLLRALLTLALLCVPVTLMGTTLPLLSRFVARTDASLGRRIGALYAANTAGAVLGCFVTGFLLLAAFGYTGAAFVGVTLNILVGIGAILVSLRFEPIPAASPPVHEAPVTAPGDAAPGAVPWLLVVTAICGFSGLALEVIWTRLLAIVFLGTTYAYTTMLTAFLCGIAAGGCCAALFADRIRRRQGVIGVVLFLIGLSAMLMLGWTAALPERFIEIQRGAGTNWPATIRGIFLLSFMTLFPMTFFFGLAFPLIVRACSTAGAHVGRSVGGIYGANTFGGVCGAIAGGFILLPWLGAHRGIVALSLLLVLTGLTTLWRCRLTPGILKAALTALFVAGYGIAWSMAPADVSQALNIGYVPADHRVLFYREGVEGTVAVSEPDTAVAGEDRVLWINRVQATTSIERGVKMNRLQGVLPLLFERDYPDVLFMCFGSGITCGTLALYDFDTIDAVEISPEVLEAAPLFDRDNLGVLHNPKVSFHVDDGRNYLLRTDRYYDVITFEPMPLALAGVSTFYTREYYQLCLNRLKPGGMVSQWVPLHSNDPEIVRALVHTFITVFPEYCAFFVNADLFLLGSDQPLRMHYERASERLAMPALRDALAQSGLGDVVEVMSCFLMDKDALDAYAQNAGIMLDNRPWAEFIMPRLVYARRVPEAIETLKPHVTSPLAGILEESISASGRDALERRYRSRLQDFDALQLFYGGVMLDFSAANAFIASLEIDPDNRNAQYYLKEIVTMQSARFMRWGEYDSVLELVEKALGVMPDDEDLHALRERAVRNANAVR